MQVKHHIDGPTVTTTAGEVFIYADHCLMAALIYRRFGYDTESAAAAWSRMMESSSDTTVADFLELAIPGGNLLRAVRHHWS